MTEKRFTLREPKVDNDIGCSEIADNGEWISYGEIVELLNNLSDENEQLKQQLSDINGQLVMLDNCDNWDYDRMKHTVREIAEIIGYNGTINPKR